MKLKQQSLLDDLHDRSQKASALVHIFLQLDPQTLQRKEDPNSWSVLECVEHLNRYFRFYLPLLHKAIRDQKDKKPAEHFKTGWLGQFFVQLMQPQEGRIKKMKAVALMNPNGQSLDLSTLHEFIDHQNTFIQLIAQARAGNLKTHRIPTVMSGWITLSLGDTMRFITVHNERHLLQAQNSIKSAH